MKYAFLLMALLVSFNSTKTLASDIPLKEGMIVTFKDTKDPGKYIFERDGKIVTVFHYYQTVDLNEISSVQAGEKFKAVIDKKLGMGLLRLKNNKLHKVWIFGETPIDHRVDTCLETAMTTLSISGCFNTAAKAWQFEFDYHYTRIAKSMTTAQKTKLLKYKEKWLQLIESKKSLHFERIKNGGTIQKNHIASLIADFKKQMTMTLWVYD